MKSPPRSWGPRPDFLLSKTKLFTAETQTDLLLYLHRYIYINAYEQHWKETYQAVNSQNWMKWNLKYFKYSSYISLFLKSFPMRIYICVLFVGIIIFKTWRIRKKEKRKQSVCGRQASLRGAWSELLHHPINSMNSADLTEWGMAWAGRVMEFRVGKS